MARSAIIRKPAKSSHPLERGRKSLQRKAWGAAVIELTAADREVTLDPMDLVELAQAALLIGKERDGIEILTRAHQAFLNRDQAQPAARCAFWLAVHRNTHMNIFRCCIIRLMRRIVKAATFISTEVDS